MNLFQENENHEKSKFYKMIRLTPKESKVKSGSFADVERQERLIYNNLPSGYKFKFENGHFRKHEKQTNSK